MHLFDSLSTVMRFARSSVKQTKEEHEHDEWKKKLYLNKNRTIWRLFDETDTNFTVKTTFLSSDLVNSWICLIYSRRKKNVVRSLCFYWRKVDSEEIEVRMKQPKPLERILSRLVLLCTRFLLLSSSRINSNFVFIWDQNLEE